MNSSLGLMSVSVFVFVFVFVFEQRWLWYAINYATDTVLEIVFGKCKDEVFKQIQVLL